MVIMKCPVCGAIYRPLKENTGSLEQKNVGYTQETTITSPSSPPTPSSPPSPPTPPSPSPTCRRCKVDLSDLLRLHDQTMWSHRQAQYLLAQRCYAEAAAHNNQAIALYSSNADFHALAGKLWALQGEFREAIASWQQALKFDPENAIACDCLQMIKLMAKNHHA
ncbi:tetratricopeptide repeat protein [Nostoc sp. CHAB 5836]|uniref:tetratricopeptide repeat protein n=1 Tax=Nostoc sp. CHAB 5836 TaxID=2780404 RepID=UPI001E468C31|nr:tetratricopeptide repeat protein [Nostoc sp. CHAB 5836]MCC5617324.1 tetratricopeptide repeat protein [Nostoc sp. CHAB 5836]